MNDVSCVNLGGSSWRAGPSCSSASAASSRNSGLCSPSQQRQRGSRDRARTVHVRPCPSRQQLAERNAPRVRALRTDVVGRCDQSDATRLEHPAQVSWPAPAVQHDQTLNVPPTSFSYSGCRYLGRAAPTTVVPTCPGRACTNPHKHTHTHKLGSAELPTSGVSADHSHVPTTPEAPAGLCPLQLFFLLVSGAPPPGNRTASYPMGWDAIQVN